MWASCAWPSSRIASRQPFELDALAVEVQVTGPGWCELVGDLDGRLAGPSRSRQRPMPGHASERLVRQFAEAFGNDPEAAPIFEVALDTLGQQIARVALSPPRALAEGPSTLMAAVPLRGSASGATQGDFPSMDGPELLSRQTATPATGVSSFFSPADPPQGVCHFLFSVTALRIEGSVQSSNS